MVRASSSEQTEHLLDALAPLISSVRKSCVITLCEELSIGHIRDFGPVTCFKAPEVKQVSCDIDSRQ